MKLPIGLMQTAGAEPEEVLLPLIALGIRDLQLGVPETLPLDDPHQWRSTLAVREIRLHTVFGVYSGESYADIPSVQRTVGFVPPATREQRVARTLDLITFAEAAGCSGIATHIGFVSEDRDDPDRIAVIEAVRRIADEAAEREMTFALETGQESADVLLDFLHEINRDNVGVNFDPANLIMYGTGDPIRALGVVGQHVITVHAKDGDPPSPGDRNALGKEQPLGKGRVDFPALLKTLQTFSYHGPLFIEREIDDPEQRMRDLEAGKHLLETLMG